MKTLDYSQHTQGNLLQNRHLELVLTTFESLYFSLTLKAKENKVLCADPKSVYPRVSSRKRDTKAERHIRQ